MAILIRKAKVSDIKFLVSLAKELMDHNMQLARNDKTRLELLQPVDNVSSLWRRWALKSIKSPNGLVLVAESNGEIIGYSLNLIKENVKVHKIRKIGHVSDLYVSQGYRNKGIATKFMKEALKWFKKKELKYLSIGVHAKNMKAHKIYKRWGFFDYHTEMRRKLG